MTTRQCRDCSITDDAVHLHVEIENLKQQLMEKESHIVSMETNFLNEANKYPNGEMMALREELLMWQEKYKRLYEAHRRVQRVNQGLEDKLLKLVDVSETEKSTLTKDIATLSHNLAEANYAVKKLTEDNERYKNDVNIAIQFLQCKQTNYVSQRFDTLPTEVQSKVATYMTSKRTPDVKRTPPEVRSIKVPIPTFPPTAMVYSVPKSPHTDRRLVETDPTPDVDIVSAAIMAKVLEERQKERALAKHCDTCTCAKTLKIIYDVSHHNIGTQTIDSSNDTNDLGSNILRPIDKKYSTDLELNHHQSIISNVVKVHPNNFLKCETSAKPVKLSSDTTVPIIISAMRLTTPLKSTNILLDNSSSKRRVADWINTTNSADDAATSLADDSRLVETLTETARLAEMEENVKRFLFGESEFMKTVELGKLKYQNYHCNDNSSAERNSGASCHTETEI